MLIYFLLTVKTQREKGQKAENKENISVRWSRKSDEDVKYTYAKTKAHLKEQKKKLTNAECSWNPLRSPFFHFGREVGEN